MRLFLTALSLLVLPGLAMAECSYGHPDQSAANCAQGMTWDTETRSCVAVTTS